MSNTTESKELCQTFASLIFKDVRRYINENRDEYEAWLQENPNE